MYLIKEAVNTLVRIWLAHITASVGLDIDLVRTDTPAFVSTVQNTVLVNASL